jgi:hypothetical protein
MISSGLALLARPGRAFGLSDAVSRVGQEGDMPGPSGVSNATRARTASGTPGPPLRGTIQATRARARRTSARQPTILAPKTSTLLGSGTVSIWPAMTE